MDCQTTAKGTFTAKKGQPNVKVERTTVDEHKPIAAMSSYQAAYPNWQNGRNDHYVEKSPQFPVYSLPF
jgi:hypothetical protein